MPETQNCEYFLVEYAPSPLREARVAIGLFLFDAAGQLVRQGFTADWRRLRCLDPQADLALLANIPAHFAELASAAASVGAAASGRGALYSRLQAMLEEASGGIQISPARGVQTTSPAEEFERLFQEHVATAAPARQERLAREGSRPWIHARLSEAVRRHALWNHLSRDVPVAEFTAPGDGFHLDFAYRPNGTTKYLHAISLERDWNQSKLLSYTFWRIRQKSEAHMTAIVGDIDGDSPQAASCREILAGAQIDLQPLSRLDSYLDSVSRELRLDAPSN